jgi:hypothetical protein
MAVLEPWWSYLGYPEWSEAATWTEQSANVNPDFPEVRLNSPQPRDRFQTLDDDSNIVLRGEVSTATDINCISMMFSNIPSGAANQYRIKLDGTSAGGSGLLDTGWLTFWASTAGNEYIDRAHSLWTTETPISDAIHMEVEISATTAENFISIGRAVAGDFLRTPLANGTALFAFIDEGAHSSQRTGVTTIVRGNATPSFPFSIYSESKADMMDYLYKIAKLRGGTRPILLVRDPLDTTYRMQTMQYGLLSNEIVTSEINYNYFIFRGTIRGMT